MRHCVRLTPLWFLAASAILVPGCARSSAQTKPKESDRSVELVVYADDFALVQESREVTLTKGKSRIGVQDVSKEMDQDSVVYTWPDAKDTKIVSSTYELGTKDAGHLLQRFLGQEVQLVYRSDTGREGERQTGILEVADPGNVVVRVGDKLIVNPVATIETSATAGVVTIPQLSAEVESPDARKTKLGVSYLTRGLSWSADYTATLAPDSDAMGLECWATVTNQTGTEFPNAKLSFVAGSPNRSATHMLDSDVPYETGVERRSFNDGTTMARPKSLGLTTNSRFESPQRTGELYAYPYKSAATIKPDQMNRVRMMGSEKVKIARDYAIRLPGFDYESFNASPQQRLTATLSLKFKNSQAGGLGLPLPGGAMRVYEPSPTGTVRYIGAATLADTPTDADISATLTDVFDIYAQCRLVESKKIDRHTVAKVVEVILNNEKDHDVKLRLVQDFWGKWKIGEETSASTRLNASSAQWVVTIPKGGKTTLKYKVLLSY